MPGTFATARHLRWERRGQRVGIAVLGAVVLAALAGAIDTPLTVGRAAAVYLFLLVVFRISGRRTLAQVTTFDLILVLVLGDATQQALVGADGTVTTTVVAVATLVIVDLALGRAKQRWPVVDAVVDGLPLPLLVHGRPDEAQMAAEGVTTDDILSAARERLGVARLEDLDAAVLEQSGGISVVPKRRRH